MGKAVLMSTQPKWCADIANLKKPIEVRKSRPKLEIPFKVYIYCTNTPKYHHLYDLTPYNNGERMYGVTEHNKYSLVVKGYLNGKVIGEFVCDRIDRIGKRGTNNNFDYCYLSLNEWGNDDIEIEITDIQKSCISKSELNAYGANSSCLYAWHITDLKIYDKPKELSEFEFPKDNIHLSYRKRNQYFKGITRPPQSWCYVEE